MKCTLLAIALGITPMAMANDEMPSSDYDSEELGLAGDEQLEDLQPDPRFRGRTVVRCTAMKHGIGIRYFFGTGVGFSYRDARRDAERDALRSCQWDRGGSWGRRDFDEPTVEDEEYQPRRNWNRCFIRDCDVLRSGYPGGRRPGDRPGGRPGWPR